MNDIMIVFGTRPQYMKAIVLFQQLLKLGNVTLVDTGQHYDDEMSSIFLKQLKFPNVINLNVGSDTHGRQTAKILVRMEDLLLRSKPDLVIVNGDTNSTLSATLASIKLNTPVAHVEAGPRSFNMSIPEEVNRVVVDSVSTFLFAPSLQSVHNLAREGRKAFNTGDVLFDVLRIHLPKIKKRDTLGKYNIDGDYILATTHRPHNVDNPKNLKIILDSLLKSPMPVILPLHPRTRKNIQRFGFQKKLKSPLKITSPVGYYDMINFIRNAEAVVTDSGGIQRETFWLRVPCLTLRADTTEWMETVNLKANFLIGCKKANITRILNDLPSFPRTRKQPYGTGHACEKIAKILNNWFIQPKDL